MSFFLISYLANAGEDWEHGICAADDELEEDMGETKEREWYVKGEGWMKAEEKVSEADGLAEETKGHKCDLQWKDEGTGLEERTRKRVQQGNKLIETRRENEQWNRGRGNVRRKEWTMMERSWREYRSKWGKEGWREKKGDGSDGFGFKATDFPRLSSKAAPWGCNTLCSH